VLTTHDLADIERLAQRLVVIDHGHIVHDGTLSSLHQRYGSRRTVVVTLDEPLHAPVRLAGADLADTSPDGRVLTFSLDGSRTPAGDLVAALASAGGLRDISINEPAIEDVIARLYAAPAQLPRTLA
jgi:ABC-2 type transport system ATP-binding protein